VDLGITPAMEQTRIYHAPKFCMALINFQMQLYKFSDSDHLAVDGIIAVEGRAEHIAAEVKVLHWLCMVII